MLMWAVFEIVRFPINFDFMGEGRGVFDDATKGCSHVSDLDR